MNIDSCHYLTESTAEYGFWVKTICDLYNYKMEDIRAIRYFHFNTGTINDVNNYVRLTKRIPMQIDVPHILIPKKNLALWDRIRGMGKLRVLFSPRPDRSKTDDLAPDKIAEYQLTFQGKSIKLWRARSDYEYSLISNDCTFVHKDDLKFFYKAIRLITRQTAAAKKPILPEAMLDEIYKNSIGFLLKGKDQKSLYKEFNIPYKRGILLAGSPGCGKTLTCRWLRELCKMHYLHHRVVTMEEYRNAAAHGNIMSCFKLPSSGIIFFDDLDVMLKDRKTGNSELGPFLTALDGMDPIDGVINIFTTNYIEELDEAFVRPGRIDLFLTFSLPNEKLRKRFINEAFNQIILEKINIENLVEQTDEYSFAEIEEIRKLLSLDFIDGKEVNLDKTLKIFEIHRQQFAERMKLGFKMNEDSPNGYACYDDEEIFFPPPNGRPF